MITTFSRPSGGFFVTAIVALFLLFHTVFALPAMAANSGEKNQTAETVKATANAKDEKTQSEPEKKQDTAGEPVTDEEEKTEPSTPGADAWEAMWSGQRAMLNEMRETALKLSDDFSEQTENLSRHLQPFEQEGRRLLVFVNTFKGHPNAMEAVNRRISGTINELELVLEPVTMARAEAQGLLERVNRMSISLPEETATSRFSQEMRDYIKDINKARLRLTAVLAQYDSLLPSMSLVKKLEETRKEISAQLPELWKNFYLQKPVAWLNPDSWVNVSRDLYYSWQAMLLRLPVEMPISTPDWGTAILRFVIGLFFGGIFSLILKKRWINTSSGSVEKHIFKVSMPWLVLGFAIMGGALSARGDFFRLFLAIGSMCLIVGETSLAWNLRRLQYPEEKEKKSPFLRFLPLAICAYTILYMPLTQPVALVLWGIIIVVAIWFNRRNPAPQFSVMQLESGALDCYSINLWICLFLTVSGLHVASMGLYLAFVALCIALEISLAGMSLVGTINEHLPKEGARAVLARLLVALAAPFVLILAVAGVCLWVAMLPGGVYLLGEYALKGVTVGATQFNILQILMIISVFYLTRTVVSMGTRFLAKLPGEGVRIDPTLITPMQTALTYTTWAIFGLFVLRSLGMELSNLAMVAGGLSVGIGFGMQTIVNNFLSGLILIFGRTLQVGDVVEVGGTTGRVRKISVRATMVETYDNAMIYVPNSEFMAGRLINWTSFSRSVRREIQVGVAYGSDTDKVIKLLISIANSHENVLKYPVPSVNFADFGASALDFRLRFWVRDFDQGAVTASQLRLAIDHVFSEEKIEIAFPQLDVHLKDMPDYAGPRAKRAALPKARPPRPRPAVRAASKSVRNVSSTPTT